MLIDKETDGNHSSRNEDRAKKTASEIRFEKQINDLNENLNKVLYTTKKSPPKTPGKEIVIQLKSDDQSFLNDQTVSVSSSKRSSKLMSPLSSMVSVPNERVNFKSMQSPNVFEVFTTEQSLFPGDTSPNSPNDPKIQSD